MKLLKFDIDGVACDHAEAICKAVNSEFYCSSKKDDVTKWDHDFGEITFVEAVERYYPSGDFILQMPVTKGFTGLLDKLKDKFHLSFITTRGHSHEATTCWIKDNFGNYSVEFVKSKELADLDVLVDDSEKEIANIVKANKIGILLKQPWNDNTNTRNKLHKLKNAFLASEVAGLEKLLIDIS